MSEIAPLLVGGALTLMGGGVTEWLRDSRAVSREEHSRRQVREERRGDLQRETLIELQMTQREKGHRTLVPEEFSDGLNEAQVLTMKLSSRVSDDRVRELVAEVIKLGSDSMIGESADRASARQAGELSLQAQERMGSLIRDL